MEKSSGCTSCGKGRSRTKCSSCMGSGEKKLATVAGIRTANASVKKGNYSVGKFNDVATK